MVGEGHPDGLGRLRRGGGEGLEAMLLCEFLESGNNEWNGIEAVVMPMQLIGLVWWKKEGRMHSIRSDPI
jgi:hypothetical protein